MIQRRVQTVSGQGRRLPAPGAPPRRGLARSRFPEFHVCSPRSTSARAMRARPGTIHTNSIRASPSRAMSFSPGSPPDPRGTTSGRPLRLFPSAALPHPPLRLFFSYSGGSRGAAEGKGRSGRGRGRARDHRCAWSRRPTRLFGLIGPARLAGDANGPADGGGHGGRQAREMALWEDRSVPHPTAPLRKPRNHAETVEPTRSAGANDPPRAPKRPPRTHRSRPATEDRRRSLRGCAG